MAFPVGGLHETVVLFLAKPRPERSVSDKHANGELALSTGVNRVPGLVSIIIPVFNRTDQLHAAVASALGQDYHAIEILIVDDGSTEAATIETLDVLARSHAPRLRVLRRENGGPGLARETGRLEARGEFLQYLDSDDVLLPGKLAAQVAALSNEPGAGVAYGITWFRDAQGVRVENPHKETGERRSTMFPSFLVSRWWDTTTPLYRACVCEAVGPWTDLRIEEDWEYDCRIASLGTRLVYCPQPVSETRDHDGRRLSRGESNDAPRLRARARSHGLVWQHARRAGLPATAPAECSLFGRSAFLLARQCIRAGLMEDADRLLRVASDALDVDPAQRRQLRWFESVASWAGPQVATNAYDRVAAGRQWLVNWRLRP